MSQSQRMKMFRPEGLEALEDRAVPSASTVQAALAQVDAQINAAYSTFAGSVFHAEGALVASGGQGTAALTTTVNQAITTLQTTLTAAVAGSISSAATALIQVQVNGSASGSLLAGMTQILTSATAGTGNGSVSPSSYPLLATAVNGTINASFTSATIEAYLYATGKASGNSSNVNLGQFTGRAEAAYGSFASTVFQAESFLYPPAGSAPSATTALNVVKVVDSQIGGLVQSLGSLVASTSVATRAAVIQGQFVGVTPGSLLYQMNSLFGASAAPDGSIPASSLPLLTAAVDAAISASFTSTAVEGYLLATA